VTTVTMTARATKKLSLQNLRKVPQKVARKKIRIPAVLKVLQALQNRHPKHGELLEVEKSSLRKELSEKKTPYSKRTFRKEVNAIARKTGKNGDIKIVKKAIKCKQGKHGKKEKKHAKESCLCQKG
jgi:hypothetical protein